MYGSFLNRNLINFYSNSNLRVGRSFFNEKCSKQELGFNVDLWKGFFVSIRPSEVGYNINFDSKYYIFNNDFKKISFKLFL